MRVLGLDIGIKTCGIALSDEMGLLAHGQENFNFVARDWASLLNHLSAYFNKYAIAKVVVGRPTYPSGEASHTTRMIEEVAALITKRFSKEVVFIDENFSTKTATNLLRANGNSPAATKAKKDIVAAEIILNDYLSLQQVNEETPLGEVPLREITVTTDDGKELTGEVIFTFEANGDEFVVYGIDEVIYAAKANIDGTLSAVEADEWELVEKIINQYLAENGEDELLPHGGRDD